MTTYNSYEAAKIANPESVIYKASSGNYATNEVFNPELCTVIECNPADHCMTVEKFLADGYKLVEGDVVEINGEVNVIVRNVVNLANTPSKNDGFTYILRTSLEERPRPKIHPDSEFYKKTTHQG